MWSSSNSRKRDRNVCYDNKSNDANVDIDIGALFANMLATKRPKMSMPFGGSNSNIYTIDNNIYFQNDITYDTMSELNKEMREMQHSLLEMARCYKIDPPPIRLHLTTHGGVLNAALSAIDCIAELDVEVHTIVDGYVASAGTLISVMGDRRFMKRNAWMLIHELRSEVWGKMSDIEDEVSNMKKMSDVIKKIYEDNTNLRRTDLTKILKRDINWSAEECLAKGLIDEII